MNLFRKHLKIAKFDWELRSQTPKFLFCNGSFYKNNDFKVRVKFIPPPPTCQKFSNVMFCSKFLSKSYKIIVLINLTILIRYTFNGTTFLCWDPNDKSCFHPR